MGESGEGGVIFEWGGRFLKEFVLKKRGNKNVQTAFYILPVVDIRVLSLVLAGLL